METRSIDALGNVRKSLTDAAGRTLRSIDALAKATVFTYDAAGNQLSVTDPNGVGQTCVYDPLGRDLSCTDTASDTTISIYDAAGNKVSATDAKSNTTTYAFDARGRQVSQTDRISGVTAFAYTATGQLASLTDAESQVTSYVYDDAGNKLQEIYPDHVSTANIGDSDYGKIIFTYDAVGRTLVRTDQQGDTCTFDYDLAGRLTGRDYAGHASGPLASVTDSDTFTYDPASRMLTAVSGRYSNTVTYTYDSAGRKSTESLTIGGQTYTSTTDYDDAGRVSKLTYPDASEVIRTYTERGQLATLAVGSTTIDTRSYDDGGRMTASSYNNGVSESRAYNTDNTLASISFTGAAIGDLSYGWDENKNKTSETIGGTMSGYGFSVGSSGYDDEDRLVNWERSDTNLDQSWNLSVVGNWNSITENSSTQNRTHGPTHEMLTVASQSVTHDAKGNMTLIPAVLRPGSDPLKMKWDFENKLIAADTDNDSTDDIFYKFDALGRRVGRDDGTANVVYFQDGQQTIADYPSGTAAGSPTYTYVYASYIDEPVMRGGSGGLRYYHRNQQYSITAVSDGGGSVVERYAYSAYGQVTFADGTGSQISNSGISNRYTYTGREWDEGLSLYHYRARMYDAVGGRFVSRDPIGYWDGLNVFTYVDNNPLKYLDAIGLTKAAANITDSQELPFEVLVIKETRAVKHYGEVPPESWDDRGVITRGRYCMTNIQDPSWKYEYDGCTGVWDSFGYPRTYSFGWACNKHDECYQTCRSRRENGRIDCDKKFYDNMMFICRTIGDWTVRLRCRNVARAYYYGVRIGAAGAYADRQRQVCSWKLCYADCTGKVKILNAE